MKSASVVMIGLAVVFGGAAIVTGQIWLDRQAQRRAQALVPAAAPAAAPVPVGTLVVAAMPLRFGTEIVRASLREIPWPEGNMPKGAFARIDDVIDGKTRRVALTAIEESEPLLAGKVTGPGQRASLTAVLEPGLRAVSVRVNDILGVAGFVLPGERVDVLLTRTPDKLEPYTDVLLQNVRVLAIDQLADDKADKPSVVKAVTLEVSAAQAQQLALAANVGTLSLSLRAAGADRIERTERVGLDRLNPGGTPVAPVVAVSGKVEEPAPVSRTLSVGVIRAMKRQDYSVPAQVPPPVEITATVRAAQTSR